MSQRSSQTGSRITPLVIALATGVAVFLAGMGIDYAKSNQATQLLLEPTILTDRLTSVPTAMAVAVDGSDRLFVTEQSGTIRILDRDRKLLEAPFLDLGDRLLGPDHGEELGLVGLTFHPKYASNGRFFVHYSAVSTEPGADHDDVISEFHVSGSDPNHADPDRERILLRIPSPGNHHAGGQLAFGPDGFLYFSIGDGGPTDDRSRGPRTDTLRGAISRIDVDHGEPYVSPPDNPYIERDGRDELYAIGLRNPWQFSFDHPTGRLLTADVGEHLYEEVDLIERGANYGWEAFEGHHGFSAARIRELGYDPVTLEPTRSDAPSVTWPIYEYSHEEHRGISIIGGFVYRGSQTPALQGRYVFGDWTADHDKAAGQIWYLEEGPSGWTFHDFVHPSPINLFLTNFGRDEAGELYALGYRLEMGSNQEEVRNPSTLVTPALAHNDEDADDEQTGDVSITGVVERLNVRPVSRSFSGFLGHIARRLGL